MAGRSVTVGDNMHISDSSFYVNTAVRALENAYSANQDITVATHISQALDALRRMRYQLEKQPRMHQRAASDPYEMDESNSAI